MENQRRELTSRKGKKKILLQSTDNQSSQISADQ
jgi:hypothetical protein